MSRYVRLVALMAEWLGVVGAVLLLHAATSVVLRRRRVAGKRWATSAQSRWHATPGDWATRELVVALAALGLAAVLALAGR